MGHDEAFGERTVEALDVGIHLGASWVRVEVGQAESGAGCLEEKGELRAVVSLELIDSEGAYFNHFLEEVGGTCRGVARVCSGEGELPLHIDSREDVPLHPVDEADNGIELHTALHLPAELRAAYLRGFCMPAGLRLEGELAVLRQETTLLQAADHSTDV